MFQSIKKVESKHIKTFFIFLNVRKSRKQDLDFDVFQKM